MYKRGSLFFIFGKMISRLKGFLLQFLLVVFIQIGKAQSSPDSLMTVYLDQAKEKISQNNYQAANAYFKKIFALKTTLPDELAYYYGLTMMKLEHYKKGKDALEKYIDLKGKDGEFYNEAQKLISEADKFICPKCQNTGVAEIKDTCAACEGIGKTQMDCNLCQSQGIEFCNVCKGQGTLVVKRSMGHQYSTCQKCMGKGYVNCQICKGKKVKTEFCHACKGNGFFNRKVTCTH